MSKAFAVIRCSKRLTTLYKLRRNTMLETHVYRAFATFRWTHFLTDLWRMLRMTPRVLSISLPLETRLVQVRHAL